MAPPWDGALLRLIVPPGLMHVHGAIAALPSDVPSAGPSDALELEEGDRAEVRALRLEVVSLGRTAVVAGRLSLQVGGPFLPYPIPSPIALRLTLGP